MRMSKASKLFSAALAVSFASSCFADDSGDRVATVLKNTPLIDGHNDVPWQYFKRVDNQIDRMDLAADGKLRKTPPAPPKNKKRAGVSSILRRQTVFLQVLRIVEVPWTP